MMRQLLASRPFWALLLSFLGLAGNAAAVHLFFLADFIFGSVAGMAAVALLGIRWGVLVAALSSLYTLVLWGHPYAVIIFTAETALVGYFYNRRGSNLALADLLFWGTLGVPMVFVFYHGIMDIPFGSSLLIALKQALNGVFNALLASGILLIVAFCCKNRYFQRANLEFRYASVQLSVLLGVILLAGGLPVVLEARDDRFTEQRKLLDKMVLLTDLADFEPNQGGAGFTLDAARRLIGWEDVTIYRTTTPPTPVPLVVQDARTSRSWQVLGSGVPELRLLEPFSETKNLKRWRASIYRYQRQINNSGWLVVEYPAAPLIDTLALQTTQRLGFLGALLTVGFVLSLLLSHGLGRPLIRLKTVAKDMVEQLAKQQKPQFPDNPITEYQEVTDTLRHVSEQLIDNFAALQRAQTSLESRVQEKTRELQNVNNLLYQVLDASTEMAIIATDVQGTILVFNSGAERMLGYSASEMTNRATPMAFHLPSEIKSRSKELSAELGVPIRGFDVFKSKVHKQGYEQRQWTYRSKAGREFPVQLTVTPIKEPGGDILGYLGIAVDVAERNKMDRMKDEFVSTVSHELRTPVTSITGALGLILGGQSGEINQQTQKLLKIANQNSQRLLELINDLLDVNRLISGAMSFNYLVLDLPPEMSRALEAHRTYAQQRAVTLLLDEIPNARVLVDPRRLQQVLTNLISNAVKFSGAGENVTLRAVIDADGRWVRVEVRDHGPGIPENKQHLLFKRFSQIDSSSSREQGGTGLGLAICREIITAMGGEIGVDSQPGQGSCFWFRLKLASETERGISDEATA